MCLRHSIAKLPGQKPATMSPVAGMRPITIHFSLHFCMVVVPDNFSPCTHLPALVVHPNRGCVQCWVVGDWQAVLNIFLTLVARKLAPDQSGTPPFFLFSALLPDMCFVHFMIVLSQLCFRVFCLQMQNYTLIRFQSGVFFCLASYV